MDEVTKAIQQQREGVKNNITSQFSNTLEKGSKLPIGTVRDFGGKKYVKVRDTKNGWKPYVSGEKKREKFDKKDQKSTSEISGVKDVKKVLVDAGLNPKHIFRSYNNKLSRGRSYKFTLAVYGGSRTGEKAVDQALATRIGDSLKSKGAEDILINENEISFKIKNK